jgi:hypothetical protein
MIRIRVVTTNDPAFAHNNPGASWGGLYVDDVKVMGTSIQEG